MAPKIRQSSRRVATSFVLLRFRQDDVNIDPTPCDGNSMLLADGFQLARSCTCQSGLISYQSLFISILEI
jgi:hypothetical protein